MYASEQLTCSVRTRYLKCFLLIMISIIHRAYSYFKALPHQLIGPVSQYINVDKYLCYSYITSSVRSHLITEKGWVRETDKSDNVSR